MSSTHRWDLGQTVDYQQFASAYIVDAAAVTGPSYDVRQFQGRVAILVTAGEITASQTVDVDLETSENDTDWTTPITSPQGTVTLTPASPTCLISFYRSVGDNYLHVVYSGTGTGTAFMQGNLLFVRNT